MLEKKTIARPYTTAIFEVAEKGSELEAWEKFIRVLGDVTQDPNFKSIEFLASSGRLDLTEFLTVVMKDLLGNLTLERENLIKILVENNRINISSEINNLFQQLVRERKGVITAQIHTRFPLSGNEEQLLQKKLTEKFGKQCRLDIINDSKVIGGIIIKIGDSVIDLSLEGRLKEFARELV